MKYCRCYLQAEASSQAHRQSRGDEHMINFFDAIDLPSLLQAALPTEQYTAWWRQTCGWFRH